MQIESGLFSHAVLQRTDKNICDVPFSGSTHASGDVIVRVRRGERVLPTLKLKKIGRAENGRFSGRLTGLPTGGPYHIDLQVVDATGKIRDRATITDVLVGDVWLLAGQSNMEGVARRIHALPGHPMVRAFYMDDHWAIAKDPVHALWMAVDPVHKIICGGNGPLPKKDRYVGPGVAFAQEMHRLTRIPQGLIASAHGGTGMNQWSPQLKNQGGNSLYGATLRRITKNGGRIAGVVWYQGESDADPQNAAIYTGRMQELVAAMRQDFGKPDMPFAIVQIARVVDNDRSHWNVIQDLQRRLPETISKLAVVPAIDLTLDDTIHVGGSDMNRLGRRLTRAVEILRGKGKGGKAHIGIKSIDTTQVEDNGAVRVVVTFDNVIGKLIASGRPTGFAVVVPERTANVVDVRLDKNKAIILTRLGTKDLAPASLHYGLGCNPVCNITDEADRSLPVFGPIALG